MGVVFVLTHKGMYYAQAIYMCTTNQAAKVINDFIEQITSNKSTSAY